MKSVLLLLTILGVALVYAELQTEDQYTEDANVVAVDDSAEAMDYSAADEMEDVDDEMEDSRRSGDCASGFTQYEAKFDKAEPLANGIEGTFEMKICNDGSFARYKSNFAGEFGDTTQLNYHLHSKYVVGDASLGSTNGHYDPTNKCGPASSNAGSPNCEADYPNNGYEAGDLSGKDGKLEVVSGAVSTGWSAKDLHPPRISEYSPLGGDTGATFSSIIFHKCDAVDCGTRMFGARLIPLQCQSGFTYYKAKFDKAEPLANGIEGTFKMKICNDGTFARYKTDFAGDFGPTTQLNYHLHSKYVVDDTDLKSTKGHYDYTNKCGPASSNAGSSNCDTGVYGDKGYEAGDLSAKNGKLEVVGNSVTGWPNHGNSRWSPRDVHPPRISDFSWKGGDTGATFSSIIFHKCDAVDCSARMFGARLIKSCAAQFYKAVLDGSDINGGVTGKFDMRICNDGSRAKYTGKLKGVDSDEQFLKYHVHVKFDKANVDNTGGHYDPTHKCGPKSANGNYGDAGCPDTGVYPDSGYELGDLSGKNGNPAVTDGNVDFRIIDLNPPLNAHFVGNGNPGTGAGADFASIVFHRGSNNGKYFGFRLEKQQH